MDVAFTDEVLLGLRLSPPKREREMEREREKEMTRYVYDKYRTSTKA